MARPFRNGNERTKADDRHAPTARRPKSACAWLTTVRRSRSRSGRASSALPASPYSGQPGDHVRVLACGKVEALAVLGADDDSVAAWSEVFEGPAVAKGVADDRVADLRAEAGLGIGECQNVHQRAGSADRVQASGVSVTLCGVEHVEQDAVDDRVEAGPFPEVQGISDVEPRRHPLPGGVPTRLLHRGRREVDAEHVVAEPGHVDRVLTHATPRVEDRTLDPAVLFQVHDRGLGLSDDPRRGESLVGGIKQRSVTLAHFR